MFCYERVINRHSQWTVKTDAAALDLLRLLCDFTSLFQPPHRNRSPLMAPTGSMNENDFKIYKRSEVDDTFYFTTLDFFMRFLNWV